MQQQPGSNDVEIGDRVQMRKRHPCGENGCDEFTVIRTGADVKIRCCDCGKIIMLDRMVFLKRRKKLICRMSPEELLLQRIKELTL
ncbi:hypothetical protein FACS1894184_05380 [Clostridia bacterium]|nr:hypothetical protein FACS1894184_05380 [Clostridia bacterium]